jgi:uncharacterized membrane protein YhfC
MPQLCSPYRYIVYGLRIANLGEECGSLHTTSQCSYTSDYRNFLL